MRHCLWAWEQGRTPAEAQFDWARDFLFWLRFVGGKSPTVGDCGTPPDLGTGFYDRSDVLVLALPTSRSAGLRAIFREKATLLEIDMAWTLNGINAPPFEGRETVGIRQRFTHPNRTCSQLHINHEPVLANACASRSFSTSRLTLEVRPALWLTRSVLVSRWC